MTSVTSGLQVRIRTSEDAKAAPLFVVPFGTDLDTVLDELGRWGVSTEYGEFDREALSGQYVTWHGEAFFEVIVNVG